MRNLVKKSIAILALLGIFAQVNAQDSFIYQDTILKGEDGKSAKVYVGVPLLIVKDLGKEVKVSIKGYIFGDEVYNTKTKDLLIAKIDNGFKVNKKDEQVELIGTLSKELVSADLGDIWSEHEEFYFEMCTQCHAGPEVNHHTMMEWEAIFGTMKGFAKLDEEEASYLLRYLKSNSSDGLVKTKH
ncbi:hypothetical protein CRU99_02620 [Malaciobacter mytili]|uniref:Molybdopterin-containing oxidoreductase I, DMSO/TMAO/BSO reductase family, monoheme c-type cytochrome n=1 Tax=Malaciobacter mytili LMG 24559 TaxID=1032238 RepID=A0AAX2AEX3_9BACT|nr:hypothetical protein [Malaciobacter mytili]AXH15501.1 molybdopterin-containing oxidoreductase I, DMSO/TMAO/BSO reductase family, monoheme c-type cytochrome [Malaciobacter mytili LMG 24559]RXI47069.1 hypothetical protein CRU99_02620 [Malaciobacter mytili]RXK15185.1 hypothetical protein CP985_09840 [Malaciobacter mytili LMG 24559]